MKQEINRIQKIVSTLGRIKTTALYDGIELSFLRFDVGQFFDQPRSVRRYHGH